jgi:probable F420-dependent oxidoreductase
MVDDGGLRQNGDHEACASARIIRFAHRFKEQIMKFGVTLPQTEIGADVAFIRRFAETAESLGFDFLLAYDHVLGADPTNRPGWTGYTDQDSFHEPFVLFGYLAAVAPKLEYAAGVIILPQRQTALVAKQVAEVDLLTGGKFRLGVGIGWNAVEYEALGMSFKTRGRRFEEQIALLRKLWTEPLITFNGADHTVTAAGLNPMPVQRPIPVWLGGMSDIAIERAGRIADGWMANGRAEESLLKRVAILRASAEKAGRDPNSLGLDGRIDAASIPASEWPAEIERWRAAGATHLSLSTMRAGFTQDDQIDAIRRFRDATSR